MSTGRGGALLNRCFPPLASNCSNPIHSQTESDLERLTVSAFPTTALGLHWPPPSFTFVHQMPFLTIFSFLGKSSILSGRAGHRTLETPFPPNNQERGNNWPGWEFLVVSCRSNPSSCKETQTNSGSQSPASGLWVPLLGWGEHTLTSQGKLAATVPEPLHYRLGHWNFQLGCRVLLLQDTHKQGRRQQGTAGTVFARATNMPSLLPLTYLPFPNACLGASSTI